MQVCFRQGLHSSQRAIMVSLHTSGNAFSFISESLVSSKASFREMTRPGEPHRDSASLPDLCTQCPCRPQLRFSPLLCHPCHALRSLSSLKALLFPKFSLSTLICCSDRLFLRPHLSLTQPHCLFPSPQRGQSYLSVRTVALTCKSKLSNQKSNQPSNSLSCPGPSHWFWESPK